MTTAKSECCGWDVWGEMAGIVSESGHRVAPERVTVGPIPPLGTSTNKRQGEEPVPGTQKPNEDR